MPTIQIGGDGPVGMQQTLAEIALRAIELGRETAAVAAIEALGTLGQPENVTITGCHFEVEREPGVVNTAAPETAYCGVGSGIASFDNFSGGRL